jgi:hypothetical protein
MNKFLHLLKFFYQKLIPVFIRQYLRKYELKFIYWYNPLAKTIISYSANDDLFEACKKELSNINNIERNNYHLHKAFNNHLVRSNLIENQWWSDFIVLVTLPDGLKFRKINKSLINRIKYSNFNFLDCFEVLHIYSLTLRFGLFELGYHLRNQALQTALSYSSFSKRNEVWKLKAKLSALLEAENFLEFDRLIPLFDNKWKYEKNLLIYLRKVFENPKKLSTKNLFFKTGVKQDQNFHKFLENKEIVVVGPSPTNKKDGYEIDKADLVIRNNFTNKGSAGDAVIKGYRCEITYLNGEQVNYIAESGNLHWPSSVLWIVGKIPYHKKIILKKLISDGVDISNLNIRSLKDVSKALFNGTLHGLPNIIIDLLNFNPKKISLFHYDLMLTKERVSSYYPKYWKKRIKQKNFLVNTRLNGLAKHDAATQFIILKSFWKKGLIKGDNDFEKVIKMKLEDYMKNLQKIYHGSNETKTS